MSSPLITSRTILQSSEAKQQQRKSPLVSSASSFKLLSTLLSGFSGHSSFSALYSPASRVIQASQYSTIQLLGSLSGGPPSRPVHHDQEQQAFQHPLRLPLVLLPLHGRSLQRGCHPVLHKPQLPAAHPLRRVPGRETPDSHRPLRRQALRQRIWAGPHRYEPDLAFKVSTASQHAAHIREPSLAAPFTVTTGRHFVFFFLDLGSGLSWFFVLAVFKTTLRRGFSFPALIPRREKTQWRKPKV